MLDVLGVLELQVLPSMQTRALKEYFELPESCRCGLHWIVHESSAQAKPEHYSVLLGSSCRAR
jgi:hypothetical protein